MTASPCHKKNILTSLKSSLISDFDVLPYTIIIKKILTQKKNNINTIKKENETAEHSKLSFKKKNCLSHHLLNGLIFY